MRYLAFSFRNRVWLMAYVLLLPVVAWAQSDNTAQLWLEASPKVPMTLYVDQQVDGAWQNVKTEHIFSAAIGLAEEPLVVVRTDVSAADSVRVRAQRLSQAALQSFCPLCSFQMIYWGLDSSAFALDPPYPLAPSLSLPVAYSDAIWGYNNGDISTGVEWAVRGFYSLANPQLEADTEKDVFHKGLPNDIAEDDRRLLFEISRAEVAAVADGAFVGEPIDVSLLHKLHLDADALPQTLSGVTMLSGDQSAIELIEAADLESPRLVVPLARGDYRKTTGDDMFLNQSGADWTQHIQVRFLDENGAILHGEPIELGASGLNEGIPRDVEVQRFNAPARDAFFGYADDVYAQDDDKFPLLGRSLYANTASPTFYSIFNNTSNPWGQVATIPAALETCRNYKGQMIDFEHPYELSHLRSLLTDAVDQGIADVMGDGSAGTFGIDGFYLSRFDASWGDYSGSNDKVWGFLNVPAIVQLDGFGTAMDKVWSPEKYISHNPLNVYHPDNWYDDDAVVASLDYQPALGPNLAAQPGWLISWWNHSTNLWKTLGAEGNAWGEPHAELVPIPGWIDGNGSNLWEAQDWVYGSGGVDEDYCMCEWEPEKNPLGFIEMTNSSPRAFSGLNADLEAQPEIWNVARANTSLKDFEVYTYQASTDGNLFDAVEHKGTRLPYAHLALTVPYKLDWLTRDPGDISMEVTLNVDPLEDGQMFWSPLLSNKTDDEASRSFSGTLLDFVLGNMPRIADLLEDNAPITTLNAWLNGSFTAEEISTASFEVTAPTAEGLGEVTLSYSGDFLNGKAHSYAELDYNISTLRVPGMSFGPAEYNASEVTGQDIPVTDDSDLGTESDHADGNFLRRDPLNTSTEHFEWTVPLDKVFDAGARPGDTLRWDGIAFFATHEDRTAIFNENISTILPGLPQVQLTSDELEESWLEGTVSWAVLGHNPAYNDRMGLAIWQVNPDGEDVIVHTSGSTSLADLSDVTFTPDFTLLDEEGTGAFYAKTLGLGTWAGCTPKAGPQISITFNTLTGPALVDNFSFGCVNEGLFIEWEFEDQTQASPPVLPSDWVIKIERQLVNTNDPSNPGPWIQIANNAVGTGYQDNLSSVPSNTDWTTHVLKYRLVSQLINEDIVLPTISSDPVVRSIAPNTAAPLIVTDVDFDPLSGVEVTWQENDFGTLPPSIRALTFQARTGNSWEDLDAEVSTSALSGNSHVLNASLSPCVETEFRIISNGCIYNSEPSNVISYTLQPDGIENMWDHPTTPGTTALTASRNMDNVVTLNWSGSGFHALVDHYQIDRYAADAADPVTNCMDWGNADGQPDSTAGKSFIDNHFLYGADPNQLYGYEVVAHVVPGCAIDPIKSPRVPGFRVANATVTGRVTYSADGSACPNVTVSAAPLNPDDQIKRSAHLAPGDELTLSHPATFTAGWWTSVGPEPAEQESYDYIGVGRLSAPFDIPFHVSYFLKQEWNMADSAWDTFVGQFNDQNNLDLPTSPDAIDWNGTPHRILETLGDWDFMGLRITDDSAFVVIGDTSLYAGTTPDFFSDPSTTFHPMPLNADTVYVDEVRVMKGAGAADLAQLLKQRNLLLTGVDPQLHAYYPCNEGVGPVIYDLSSVTGATMNARHGSIVSDCPFADQGPPLAVVGNRAVTDDEGYYTINAIRYPGDNVNYRIVPIRGTDNFTNTEEQVTLGDAQALASSVNFLNNSSYEARVRALNVDPETGDVLGDCGVAGARVKIDGVTVIGPNGSPILTGSDGYSPIFMVPNGMHYVSIEKQGHEFVRATLTTGGGLSFDPDDDDFFYQRFEANGSVFRFADRASTFFKGRIVGAQANAMLPWGESVNNIGVAAFDLVAGSADAPRLGCPSWHVTTDSATGEFSVHLPPIPFALDNVTIPSAAQFAVDDAYRTDLLDWLNGLSGRELPLDRGQILSSIALPDSVFSSADPGDAEPWYIPFVYEDPTPELQVFNAELYTDKFGEFASYQRVGDEWAYISLFNNDGEYALGVPVMEAHKHYPLLIQWEERYANHDNCVLGNCAPTIRQYDVFDPSAELTIIDNLSFPDGQSVISKPWNPDRSFHTITPYTSTAGEPDLTRGISISVHSSISGRNAVWPETGSQQAIVLGTWATEGNTFTSAGPVTVDMVLRDPPGGQSYSTWTSGTTMISESYLTEVESSTDKSHNFRGSIGPDMEITLPLGGPTIDTEVVGELEGQFSSYTQKTSELSLVNMNYNEFALSTTGDNIDEGGDLSHHTADLFVGTAKSVVFSPMLTLEFMPDTVSDLNSEFVQETVLDAYLDTSDAEPIFGAKLAITRGLNINPLTGESGINSQFVYTATHIEEQVLPDLEEMRNGMIALPGSANERYSALTDSELAAYFAAKNEEGFAGTELSFYEFMGIPFNPDSLVEAFHMHWPEIQGWNNDDPRLMRLGIPPSSEDYWVQTIQLTDTDTLLVDGNGPIYNYNPLAEEVAGIDHPVLGAGGMEGRLADQIRELNQSIRLWNEALAKNELEKFVARRRLQNGIGDEDVVMPFDLVTDNPDFEEYNAWGMGGDNTQPMILALSGGVGLDFTATQSEARRQSYSLEHDYSMESAGAAGLYVQDVGMDYGQSYLAQVTTMRPSLTGAQCEALQDLDNAPGSELVGVAIGAATAVAAVATDGAAAGVAAGVDQAFRSTCETTRTSFADYTGAISALDVDGAREYGVAALVNNDSIAAVDYLTRNSDYIAELATADPEITKERGTQTVNSLIYTPITDLGADQLAENDDFNLPCSEEGSGEETFFNPANQPDLPWIDACANPTAEEDLGDLSVADLERMVQSMGDEWANRAQESLSETSFSFHVEDADSDDSYLLAVFPGKNNNGPVFLNMGGETACPWYPGLDANYLDYYMYKDVVNFLSDEEEELVQTGLNLTNLSMIQFMEEAFDRHRAGLEPETVVIEEPTLRQEGPVLSVNGLSAVEVFGVESDEQAVVTLQLDSDSETGEEGTYELKVVSSSNPNGAVLMIDGLNPNVNYLVSHGTGGIQKTLTIEPGPVTFEHDSLMLVLRSLCQSDPEDYLVPDIADTVAISVDFIPVCTDVVLDIAGDQDEVINRYDTRNGQPNIDLLLSNYNMNYSRLQTLQLFKRPVGSTDWTLEHSWTRADSLLPSSVLADSSFWEVFPTDAASIVYPWDPTAGGGYGIGAGLTPTASFQLKAVTGCKADVTTPSALLAVDLDLSRPAVYGAPEPSDGILALGDAIEVEVNQALSPASVNSSFSAFVGGILNTDPDADNYDLSRFSSGYGLLSADQAIALHDAPSLSQQGFAFTTWFRITSESLGTERVLFHQGPVEESAMTLGINAANQFYVQFGTAAPIVADLSTDLLSMAVPEDAWCFVGLGLNWEETQDEIELLLLTPDTPEPLVAVKNVPDEVAFDTDGTLTIGNLPSGDAAFGGVLRDIRLWNAPMEYVELAVDRATRIRKREAGLWAWLPLSELEGMPAEWSRGRTTTASGEWATLPPGYAMDLNAGEGLATLPGGRQTENWTFECWVRGDGTPLQEGAIMSKGNSDNDGIAFVDNVLELFYVTDAAGSPRIEFRSHLVQLATPPGVVQPGAWHHVAVTRHRDQGTLRLLIDGAVVGTTNAADVARWTTVPTQVGARVADGDTTRFFRGGVDEVRLWNEARNIAEIDAARRQRVDVAQWPSLNFHVPFEVTAVDPTNGLATTEASQTAMYWNAGLQSENLTFSGSAALTTDAPLIELIPQEQQVLDVEMQLNADATQIQFLLPPEQGWAFEETHLRVELDTLIQDANGNHMAAGNGWSFYVRQNPLRWATSTFEVEQTPAHGTDTTLTIVNLGGQYEYFTLDRVPPWMELETTEGWIGPLETLTIPVAVAPGMSVGTYEWDLTLTGNMGYAERLGTRVRSTVAPPEMSPPSEAFAHSLPLIGRLTIDGITSHHADDFVVATINGETRGIAPVEVFNGAETDFLAFLSVAHSEQELSDHAVVEFSAWDASRATLNTSIQALGADGEPTAWTTLAGGLVLNPGYSHLGSLNAPLEFAADDRIQQDIDLNAGWNWISFHVADADDTPLEAVFSDPNILEIKNHDAGSAATNAGGFWLQTGNPMTPFSLTDRYMIRVASGSTADATLQGRIPQVAEWPDTVQMGWNGLGYPGIAATPLDLALSELVDQNLAAPGDIVQSQHEGFSMLSNDGYWVGSLDVMRPGKGYRLLIENGTPGAFHYPSAINRTNGYFRSTQDFFSSPWPLPEDGLLHTNPVLIEALIGGGVRAEDVLGAFVDGHCVGATFAVETPEGPRFFLNLQHDAQELEAVQFILQRGSDTAASIETLAFFGSDRAGTAADPVQLTFPEPDSQDPSGEGPIFAQPNPTRATTQIVGLTTGERVDWALMSSDGRVVRSATSVKVAGDRLTLDMNGLAPGIHTLRILRETGMVTLRIVKAES